MEVLGAFAEQHGIAFPLLSDEGSRVIRELGLLNERVQDDHAAYGVQPNPRHLGVPYPGVFVLDEAGVVVQKRFHESYRERDTGASLLAQTLGILPGPSTGGPPPAGGPVRVRAWLDSPTYSWFQRLHLYVEVAVAEGFHVYGRPVPTGLVPLSVSVGPIEGVEVGPASWPPPRRLQGEATGEERWGHQGTVRGSLPLTFTAPPGAGDHPIRVTLSYQACSASICLVPSSVEVELPVEEAALVGRALPSRPS